MAALKNLDVEDQIIMALLARMYATNRETTMNSEQEAVLRGWGELTSKLLGELPGRRS